MNKEMRQYFIVGLFIIIATTILCSMWLWLSNTNRQKYNTYLTIFNEPIDGLGINSVIRYNGVEVGRVKAIKLDSNNPKNILVYLNILPAIPINKKTFAVMKAQGITGLSYIELGLPIDATLNDNLIPSKHPPYPQINTKKSFLYNLSEQAQSVSNNIHEISGQIKLLLSDKNIHAFSNTINNLDKITTTLANKSNKISSSIDDITQITQEVKKSTKQLTVTLKNVDSLTHSLTVTSNNANALINNINDTTLTNINNNLLPNLNQTITQINLLSIQMEQFLQLLNNNPQALISGIKNQKLGPGE